MTATADIRFKRMQREYNTLHDTQAETLDKVDAIIKHQKVPYKPMGFVKE